MKGLSKVLSVLLILSAGFGVFNSTQSIKDVLDCKAYWEEEGKISDENLDKLDNGVSQLKENEQAYVDGTKTYEEGLATLTSGKAQLQAGVAEFSAKKAEYEAGVAKIQQLEDSGLEAKISQFMTGYAQLQASDTYKNGYSTFYQQALYNEAKDNTCLESRIETVANSLLAIPNETLQDAGNGLKLNLAGVNKQSLKTLAFVTAYGTENTGIRAILSTISSISKDGTLDNIIDSSAAIISDGDTWVTTYKNSSNPIQPAIVNSQLSGTATLLIAGILQAGLITDEATIAMLTPFAAVDESGTPTLAAYSTNVDALNIAAGTFSTVTAGLADSRQKLAEGKVALEEADKLIATNSKKIAAGEVELAEGKAKLAEYEDGESQLSDGLNQLMATETYTGLKSIKDRLGSAFNYLKANGKNLDLAKAAAAVKIGREFSADSGAKITKELTTRAVGAGAIIAAAVFALVAGFLGLAKKKGAKALSVLALVAAAVGIIAVKMAGTEMSAIAGSTIAGFSAISGGVVIAVVALVAAIALNAAKNADAE